MATTFLMTEKALDDMITQIADTYAKMRNNVQDCMLASAQYAVLNCNAKPMNKLLAAMPERLRPWLLKHVTQKNVPLVFNKEKGAIFLQEMEVVDAQVSPDKMAPVLQTLMPYLNQSLRNYFNQQPAYVLSEDKSKGEALAKKYAKGIEVKPGEIIIPFTD